MTRTRKDKHTLSEGTLIDYLAKLRTLFYYCRYELGTESRNAYYPLVGVLNAKHIKHTVSYRNKIIIKPADTLPVSIF